MKRFYIIVLLPTILFGQLQFLRFFADYASFYSSDTNAYLEIYVSVYQGNLRYMQNEKGEQVASFENHVNIIRDDSVYYSYSHKYKNTTRDTSIVSKYNQIVDIFKLELPYGDYEARVTITDKNSQLSGEYILDISTIRPGENIFLSDIELCSQIKRDTAETMYFKNNLQVMPNPGRVCDILNPLLYFYVELSNLPYSALEPRHYEFEYFITNSEGDTLRRKKPSVKKIFGPSLAEVGGMNVMALKKDTYFLNLKLTSLYDNETVKSRRKFYVYKPSKDDSVKKGTDELPDISEVYTDFSKDDLVEEFNQAKYIAIPQEIKVFNNLTDEPGMKKFLTEFWRRKDASRGNAPGQLRTNYLNRVAYANEFFRSMGVPGWKTDRGRILLMYGEASEYERNPSTMNTLPYMVWQYYDLEGGVYFIFADLNGFGDYELVHSTYRKELQDPNWQSRVQKGSGSTLDGDIYR